MYQLDKDAFGTFLAALRREKGLTQRQLAETLFVSDKAVSKWERGVSQKSRDRLRTPMPALFLKSPKTASRPTFCTFKKNPQPTHTGWGSFCSFMNRSQQ